MIETMNREQVEKAIDYALKDSNMDIRQYYRRLFMYFVKIKSPQHRSIHMNRIGMQKKANDLVLVFLLDLFANSDELLYPEVVKRVKENFNNLVEEDYIKKVLVENEIGKDSFFECQHKSIGKRFVDSLKYPLKRRIITFHYSRKKSKSATDSLHNKASYEEEIKNLKLNFLTDPENFYRGNGNSRVWSFYQIALKNCQHPRELAAFSHDLESISRYTV